MKTAVLTWHNYPNFGSALQAYALHTFINRNGGDATIVNYAPNKIEKIRGLRLFFSNFDSILPKCVSDKLHYRFLAFAKKHFRTTRKMYKSVEQMEELNSEFQTFVCGSDQIWAPNVLNEAYLLSFVSDSNLRISYAASIGLPVIPKSLKHIYYRNLTKFHAISVREEQGRSLLASEFNISSSVVLDPTLLLNKFDWCKIMRKNRLSTKLKSQYILCYFLGQSEKHRKIVEEISIKLGLKVIVLSRFAIDSRPSFIKEIDAGPEEFIGYIDNAALVITDSFHGLCFSINMNKDFYVVKRFAESDPVNQNSRITNILSKLELSDRLIEDVPDNISSIDYSKSNMKLNQLRDFSVNFLLQNKVITKK